MRASSSGIVHPRLRASAATADICLAAIKYAQTRSSFQYQLSARPMEAEIAVDHPDSGDWNKLHAIGINNGFIEGDLAVQQANIGLQ